jgi:cytochrome oxidase Cu insertion factor (SCO1/SenC/PrrC family)
MALDDVGNDKDTSETNADKISLQNDDVRDNPVSVDDANEEDLDEFLNKYGMTKSKGVDENIIIQMVEDSPTNSDIAPAFRPSSLSPPTKNADNLDSGEDSDSPLSTPIIAKKRRIIIEEDDDY